MISPAGATITCRANSANRGVGVLARASWPIINARLNASHPLENQTTGLPGGPLRPSCACPRLGLAHADEAERLSGSPEPGLGVRRGPRGYQAFSPHARIAGFQPALARARFELARAPTPSGGLRQSEHKFRSSATPGCGAAIPSRKRRSMVGSGRATYGGVGTVDPSVPHGPSVLCGPMPCVW